MPPPAPILRADAPVLHRGLGELQLGTDPRWSVRLTGLSPAQEQWARRLRAGRPLPRSRPADAAERAQVEKLIEVLAQAALLVQAEPHVAGPHAADLPALRALRYDGAGTETLRRRARVRVGVSGLGRVGAAIATGLATAGVGSILLDDDRPVQSIDVGLGLYGAADVGRPRARALGRVLAEYETRESALAPHVAIVVEHLAADPDRFDALMATGTAHLSVVIRRTQALVGPFVLPGRTACVRCLDQASVDGDPAWPLVSRQLRAVPDGEPEETVLAATTAALAIGQALMAIDGALPRTASAVAELSVPDAVPRLRPTGPHPNCGCVRPAAMPNGSPV